MTFTRIEGEPRLLVYSRTNPDQAYVVDLDYREERWHRPKVQCGCIRGLDGKPCIHVRLVQEAMSRIGLSMWDPVAYRKPGTPPTWEAYGTLPL